jgi:hypothetical protein
MRQNEESDPEVVTGPFCRHLRSKKFYFIEGQPEQAADFIDGSNHCWCFLTMQVVGPEGALVHPEACRADRICYQPPDDSNLA